MLFGERLREVRQKIGISLKQLSRLSEVSPSYLSVLENEPDRIPSVEILAKLLYGLRQGDLKKNKVMNGYVEIQDLLFDSENLSQDLMFQIKFITYFKNFINHKMSKKSETVKILEENLYENKVMFFKDGRYQTTQFPTFDLDWLLKQNQFEVYYTRKYITNPDVLDNDDDSRANYNTLTDEDKLIIREIIKAYIKNKYETISKPKEYFTNQINKNSEKNKNELMKIVRNRSEKFNDKTYEEILELIEEEENLEEFSNAKIFDFLLKEDNNLHDED
ncbi:helix-turn-helix transcriptional regulator [Macrococcus psychrotolerans]|uniref:Helix-turn-helix transcriptional regulator n=1 Tax=Macrococcus psychrotolerans TaxID=3039389 RepID=A0AAU6RBM3_9STAP